VFWGAEEETQNFGFLAEENKTDGFETTRSFCDDDRRNGFGGGFS
jgi:hypothetical protein